MNIEDLIRSKRSLERSIIENQDKESKQLLEELLKTYYANIKVCEHGIYCDNGYYRYHNNEIYKTDKENAQFKSLICPICHDTISILKTNNPNWDSEILNNTISIVTPFQFNYKKIHRNILASAIISIIGKYYNSEQEYCGHLEFIHNGYYQFGSPVRISTLNQSDFRIVTCTCCNKSYFLPKSQNKYWNATLFGNPISVYDVETEKAKQYFISYETKSS